MSTARAVNRFQVLPLWDGASRTCSFIAIHTHRARQMVHGTAHDLDHVMQISRVLGRQYTDEVGPWHVYLRIISGRQG